MIGKSKGNKLLEEQEANYFHQETFNQLVKCQASSTSPIWNFPFLRVAQPWAIQYLTQFYNLSYYQIVICGKNDKRMKTYTIWPTQVNPHNLTHTMWHIWKQYWWHTVIPRFNRHSNYLDSIWSGVTDSIVQTCQCQAFEQLSYLPWITVIFGVNSHVTCVWKVFGEIFFSIAKFLMKQ